MIGGIRVAFMHSLSCKDLLRVAGSLTWRCTPVILAFGKWRQEHQLLGILGYIVRIESQPPPPKRLVRVARVYLKS